MTMLNHQMSHEEVQLAAELGYSDARYAFDEFCGRSLSNQTRKGITNAEHRAFVAWLEETVSALTEP